MNLFLFADQNLMAPNLTQIARDLGLDDTRRDVLLGGNISFVFWVLGGVVTLGIGGLTDLVSRKRLLAAVVVGGEIPCLLTGFAQTYDQLFWLRALTGIGIGGALPLSYSLVGDCYSYRDRAKAAAWIGLAQGLGIAAGQLLAGTLGPSHGWRLPFILVACPNFALALVFALFAREPPRGAAEEGLQDLAQQGGYSARLDWKRYVGLFRIRTNLLAFLQGIPGTVPWGVFFVFLNDFYSQDKGFSVQGATLVVMATGAAAIAGSFAGGMAGNRLYNVRPALLPVLCGVSTLAGTVPMALLLGYPPQAGVADPSPAVPIAFGVLTGFCATITGPNVKAMLLNVNAPETRGSIFSLFNLADDLGKGFGPVVISALVTRFGRLHAFHLANLFWVPCGLVLLAMAITFPRDAAALEARMRERAASLDSGAQGAVRLRSG